MVKFARTFTLLALIVGVVLPALPAEGEIGSGSATGIQQPGKTGVTITGLHNPGSGPANNPFPCRPSATVFDVIKDVVNSDVSPFQGAGSLTLPLAFQDSDTCIYVHPGRPKVKLLLGADGAGNTFSFRLEYRQGSYLTTAGIPTTPSGCPPGPDVSLLTSFTLDAPNAISFTDTAVWNCFGPPLRPSNFLSTP